MPYNQLTIAIFSALLAGSCAAAPTLYITTEHSPPASMVEGGVVVGHGTEKVREIMARSGISYSIELLPWMRAYTSALQRRNGCVYSTTRTEEREKLFKWVGPTNTGEWVLMGRSDRKFELKTLDDARGLRIGTYHGDAREEYLRSRGFKVDSAQNDLINPRKLMLNRIDLWAASLRSGSAVLAQNGWTGQIVPVLTFAKVQVYLACNPAVPDALVARMNAALESMERDGTARRIERKYDQAPPQTKAPAD
ncbi:substrate-binding periplasmic protein [Massilia cavernae]|uniref:ABC transporter substrate-binding protein n=1 Tax=Massilia cavernae TaxID=2320864 RepID=A0A418XRW3_9BURK|nr:transporter substrate-binding domain-containing protein [Massilia cavernae]RJG15281.1 ABC transporter substrate-binding protein [Massilia cavernae]